MITPVVSSSQKEYLREATDRYQQNLKEPAAEDVREYLKTARHLSGANALSFKLGYVGDPLPGHEQYRGCLAIPYDTRSGIVSMRFRRIPVRNPNYRPDSDPLAQSVLTADMPDLDQAVRDAVPEWLPLEGPKYLSTTGDTPQPFNVRALYGTSQIMCVTEGEIDCMTVVEDGLPAIGIAGVNAWRSAFGLMLAGYRAVYILADNDDKGQGQGFAEKVAVKVPNSRIVLMDAGHDVNSFFVANGPGSIKAKIEGK